jgi:DNA-binding transcriptional ArsR family regulator
MNEIFKALSDPTRRKVLELLRRRPMTAGEIAGHFVFSKPTMSAHFAVLRGADLVGQEKVGREVIYRLKMSVLEEALLSFAQAVGFEFLPRARRSAYKGKAKKEETSP